MFENTLADAVGGVHTYLCPPARLYRAAFLRRNGTLGAPHSLDEELKPLRKPLYLTPMTEL